MTSHGTGAEILGLDLSRPVGDELKKQINRRIGHPSVYEMKQTEIAPGKYHRVAEGPKTLEAAPT